MASTAFVFAGVITFFIGMIIPSMPVLLGGIGLLLMPILIEGP